MKRKKWYFTSNQSELSGVTMVNSQGSVQTSTTIYQAHMSKHTNIFSARNLVPKSVLNVYICNDSIAGCQAFSTKSSSEVSASPVRARHSCYGCEPKPLPGSRLPLFG
jgi:hypothetical protein